MTRARDPEKRERRILGRRGSLDPRSAQIRIREAASPCRPERNAVPRNASSAATRRPCTAEAQPQAERAVTSRDCTPVNFEEPDKDLA